MHKKIPVQKMTAAALLIAVGVVIPLVMPIKLVLEPASFTLASHVAIFLAMFISPPVAVAVAAGTAFGFLMGPFPLVVALRAASHVVFALLGALWLKKHPYTLSSPLKAGVFSLAVAVVHAMCEVGVVSAFYFGGAAGTGYYQVGFMQSVLVLVGLGTIVHSMVDFGLALLILPALGKQASLGKMFGGTPYGAVRLAK